MTDCNHEGLHISASVFNLTAGEDGTVRVRAAHMKVHCRACGMHFRFVGDHRAPPDDALDALAEGGPWASGNGDELAAWIVPMQSGSIAEMRPEGSA